MKNRFLNLLGLLMVGTILIFSSCKDDGPDIDPGDGDVNLANGYFLATDGGDPAATLGLSSELVELGFDSQERSGFLGGSMWLEAGSYKMVQVTDKEIAQTIGGAATTIVDSASVCDLNEYIQVATQVDGPAFAVGTSGLYKVTYDVMTDEMIIHQIVKSGLIGDATPNGWGGDTDLPGSVTAAGGEWKAEGIVLRNGFWKNRFNCRWSIDRRTDMSNHDPESGYVLFTNLGGSVADPTPGGANIEQTEEGTYTVTVAWSPITGWSMDLDRTGDAPILTFDPNDFKFGIAGNATAQKDMGWDNDRNLFYSFGDDIHSWYGVVTFREDGVFKIRANDDWDVAFGGTFPADGTETTLGGGDDIPTPGAGAYYITISTADEGTTWIGTMQPLGWSVIGEGSPSMNWDDDTAFAADALGDEGQEISTYRLTGEFGMADWKIRAGGDWKLNFGGTLNGLIFNDGMNLSLNTAGSYELVLSFNGAELTAVANPQ